MNKEERRLAMPVTTALVDSAEARTVHVQVLRLRAGSRDAVSYCRQSAIQGEESQMNGRDFEDVLTARNDKIDLLAERNAKLLAALKDTCRILEAVGYTTVFSKGQKERIESARAEIAKASMDSKSSLTESNK